MGSVCPKNFGFKTSLKESPEEKIKEAITIYESMTEFYFDYLHSKDGKAFINEFNLQFPKYPYVTEIKKLGSII